jgi:hypothetical protein
MAYNLGSLRTYVRDLTGVYATDLLPDATVTAWINEVYFDVARQQEWPWLPVTALASSGDAPAFADEYRPLLAYRVAAKVLTSQADDTTRGELYIAEYQSILNAMYQDNLQALSTGSLASLADVQRYVRDLLNIYDDTVTDSVIANAVSETYADLYYSQSWPTLAASPIPYGTAGIGRALAYGVASRLAPRYAMSVDKASAFSAEYQAAVAFLKQTLLTDAARTGITTGMSIVRGQLSWLRNHVKMLTGEFSQTIPDVLINDMLSEEYQMLASSANWPWTRFYLVSVYPAGSAYITLASPASPFPFVGTNPYKIENLYVVKGADANDPDAYLYSSDESEIVYNVPHVLDGVGSDVDYRYVIDTTGKLTITPTPTEDITIKLRGQALVSHLSNDVSYPNFDSRFVTILSYRTAIKILTMSGVSDQRIPLYDSQANDLYELMRREYLTSSSTEPLQLGGSGLTTRKYLPWFRVA